MDGVRCGILLDGLVQGQSNNGKMINPAIFLANQILHSCNVIKAWMIVGRVKWVNI